MATLGDLWGLGLIFGTIGCTFLLLLLKQAMNAVEALTKIADKLDEPVETEVHYHGCGCDDVEDDDDEGEEWKRGGD